MSDATVIPEGTPQPQPQGGPGTTAAKGEFDDFPIVAPGGEQKPGEFDEFPLAAPTGSQKISAFGESATRGLVESGSILTGMTAGAAIGTLGGPAAPVTVPLGAAVGAGAGFLFSEGVSDLTGLRRPEEMPEGVRPFAFAGEVVGASVPFAGAPLAAARVGARLPPSTVGTFINKIIDTAARAPGKFFASEAAGIGGAALAGGVAGAFRPGETGVRVAAEIGGGFFNPTRLLVGVSDLGVQGVRRAVQSLTPAGRETAAAKVLQEIVEDAGEDPELLGRLLRESGIPGTNLTAAQRTGSPALIALETRLMKDSAKFGAEAEKRAKDAVGVLNDSIAALRATGDPTALSQAADLRLRYFRTLITSRVQSAEREALEAAGKITSDSPKDMAALSKTANDALGSAMKEARAAERELWGKVSRDIPAAPNKILSTYDDLRAGILPEEKLPDIVEGFVSRMKEAGSTTSGELMLIRSRALELAREAAGKGEMRDASAYGRLAEAALDDIDGIFTGPEAGVLRTFGATKESYDAARAFSRELHDTFTRTFAGQALATTGRGAERIPPELMMRRALAAGREGGELRLREIEEATGFAARVRPDSPEAAANVDSMLKAQERVLRLAAAESIDPNTGRVSPTRLGRFIRNNEALLEKFPEASKDLRAAVGNETKLRDIQNWATDANRVIERQTAFAQVAKVENPSDAVRAAVQGRTPVNDLSALAKLARRGGPRATDGLKATVMDYAIERATSSDGTFDLTKLKAALFSSVGPGQESIVQVMRREGVFSAAEVKRFGEVFDRAAKIGQAVAGNKGLEKLIADPDAITDMILRVAGAKAGATLASGTSGATLVAAGRGSSFARNIFAKMPGTRISDVLKEAAMKPEFMALLLEKPKTQAEGLKLARQIHSYLLQAGITASDESPDEPTGAIAP